MVFCLAKGKARLALLFSDEEAGNNHDSAASEQCANGGYSRQIESANKNQDKGVTLITNSINLLKVKVHPGPTASMRGTMPPTPQAPNEY